VSVLVVGRDARTAARLLRAPDLEARGVRSCDQAVTLLELSGTDIDVVVVAPYGNWTHLLSDVRRIRESGRDRLIFVLVESATDPHIVDMLDQGVDDFVVDPVAPGVLAARVRARLRRRRVASSAARASRGPLGDLVVDRSARRCFVRDREVGLRAKEFDLLDALASNAGRVVTRTTLMNVVWDEHWFKSTKTLDVTMVGLRRHLREAADQVGGLVPQIRTMRAVGYRMDVVRPQPEVSLTDRASNPVQLP
jgi:DNA-binding response OmpR family regulator